MRYTIASLAGALATLISGSIIAIIMQPWMAPHFGEFIRTKEEGLLFPSLIGGYLVIGFCLSYLASNMKIKDIDIVRILIIGAVMGLAIFLGDHLITAGWSRLNAGAMAISGLLDSLSLIVGFLVVSLVYRYKTND
jgi:hypothetical protein